MSMLKPATYTSKNNLIYVSGDWLFSIDGFDSDKSISLYQLAIELYVLNDAPRALGPFRCCKATTPLVKGDELKLELFYFI